MNFLGLFSGGRFTGTNGPNRFVSQDQLAEISRAQIEERFLDLGFNDFKLFAGFAFVKYFADTENGGQAFAQGQFNLGLQNGIGFTIISTTFGMAEDDVLSTRRFDHAGGHFAGIGSRHMIGTVLGSDTQFGRIYSRSYGSQVNKGSANNDVAVGLGGSQQIIQFSGQCEAFLQGLVHFPVTCYDVFSH
ncbi:MAG: hypothetical protein BWY72_01962 [Bacteroidetes bacterium ADurb.Bin416]|nr:MAG: hypothetical protein BWY72_01962 [Bacteroidetes bacterium ADurb.Bin416]